MKEFDIIVIGSGQGGTPLSKKLATAGFKTALIEKKAIGGSCVNVGCTPTKAMIACAEIAYKVAHSDEWGVDVKEYTVDLEKIISRKNKIVKSFREASEKGLQKTTGLTLFFGEATFIDHKTLSVITDKENETLTADKIFIDTGLAPRIPDLAGLDSVPYYTSTSLLDISELPEHLLILGGSYVGLEFGQMFRRFGSKVTILENGSQLLSHEDEDIAQAVKEILEEEDIDIFTNSHADKIAQSDKLELTYTEDGKQQSLNGSHILFATGRIPQTKELDLGKTGVKTDEKGFIKVNERLETNVPGIYALGDVKGGPAFTHISYNDHLIVLENLLEKKELSTADRQIPYCMFIDPQLGRIGMTEKEARKKGYDIEIATLPMKKTSRGIETGNTRGIMKAVVDKKSDKILGAAMLGDEGGEVMTVIQMAMLGGFTATQLRKHIFAHPLYSESLNNLFMTLE